MSEVGRELSQAFLHPSPEYMHSRSHWPEWICNGSVWEFKILTCPASARVFDRAFVSCTIQRHWLSFIFDWPLVADNSCLTKRALEVMITRRLHYLNFRSAVTVSTDYCTTWFNHRSIHENIAWCHHFYSSFYVSIWNCGQFYIPIRSWHDAFTTNKVLFTDTEHSYLIININLIFGNRLPVARWAVCSVYIFAGGVTLRTQNAFEVRRRSARTRSSNATAAIKDDFGVPHYRQCGRRLMDLRYRTGHRRWIGLGYDRAFITSHARSVADSLYWTGGTL